MNSNEKKHVHFLNAMIYKSQHIIDEIAGGSFGNSTDGKKFLQKFRQGRTILKNALEERIAGLDEKTKRELGKNSNLMDLHWGYKKDAAYIFKKYAEEDRKIREQVAEEIGPEPIYVMAEFAMAFKCTGCDGSPLSAPGGCYLHDSLQLFQIPVADESLPCGYMNDVSFEHLKLPAVWEEEIGALKQNMILANEAATTAQEEAKNTLRHSESLTNTVAQLQADLQSQQDQNRTLMEKNNELFAKSEQDTLELQRLRNDLQRLSLDLDDKQNAVNVLTNRLTQIQQVTSIMFEGMDILREFSSQSVDVGQEGSVFKADDSAAEGGSSCDLSLHQR